MSSIIPEYEYDIFISYRQKDNKQDNWVTEFVETLKNEIEATFKEDISIYFDENPHEGIHDAHDVDESLKAKLKCLIFIPIVSHTYCDPEAFAWKHEFLAFRNLAEQDNYGLKIKVKGGNVINRILPVTIHDLDSEDITLFEKESRGVMRSIEFVFSSAGVNRPLLPNEERPGDNLNNTYYRDQINKVAGSVKQLILGFKNFQKSEESENEKVVGVHIETSEKIPKPKFTNKILIGALTTLVILLGYFAYSVFRPEENPDPFAEKSVAVLPFVNLSRNVDEEYFSDGITGDIIIQISKISDLKVIARSSVMRYKGTKKDIIEIGKELNVETILEGTVRLSDTRARITANLSNASNRQQLWAETYDREINDLFQLQADVSRDIVVALNANFSSIEKSLQKINPTESIGAYNSYLKAKYNYDRSGPDGYAQSLAHSLDAVRQDPEFSLAYAALANSYSLIAYYQYYEIYDIEEAREKALEASAKAIELDPGSAEAHDARGYALRTHRWDWAGAEEEVKKAIALNPRVSTFHRRYALLLAATGRFDEAINEVLTTLELDPLGAWYNSDLARIYYYAGKLDKAIETAIKSFELEPGYRPAMGVWACSLEQMGLNDSSVVVVSQSATRSATDYEGTPEIFEIDPKPYKVYWKEVLERSLDDAKEKPISNVVMAVIYMRNEDHDGAIESLQKAFANKEGSIVYIKAEPLFRPLHGDPRFEKIVSDMGL